MVKQGVRTIIGEFIRTRALSHFSFMQFRPYATSFPWLFPSLTFLFKRNMAEKDICRAHTFPSLDFNFSFCMNF